MLAPAATRRKGTRAPWPGCGASPSGSGNVRLQHDETFDKFTVDLAEERKYRRTGGHNQCIGNGALPSMYVDKIGDGKFSSCGGARGYQVPHDTTLHHNLMPDALAPPRLCRTLQPDQI